MSMEESKALFDWLKAGDLAAEEVVDMPWMPGKVRRTGRYGEQVDELGDTDWTGVEEYCDLDPSELSPGFLQAFATMGPLLGYDTDLVDVVNDPCVTQSEENSRGTEDASDELGRRTRRKTEPSPSDEELQLLGVERRCEELLTTFKAVHSRSKDIDRGVKRVRLEDDDGNEEYVPAMPAMTKAVYVQSKLPPTAGDGMVRPEKSKIYRAQLPSTYEEPMIQDDDSKDWIFHRYGRSLARKKAELPPRDDIIEFDLAKDEAELKRNLNLKGCPDALQPRVIQFVKDNWDAFAEEGLRNSVRGFTFQIDTGTSKPVDCGAPRYGPNESVVMNKLIDNLEHNGLVEDDDGPWGAMVVLAAKPNQGLKHYTEYQWRLCVSYRKLNQVTRPFKYPIPRCDDAVEDIDPEAKWFIAVDMDSEYWQLAAEPEARAKLAFYTPNGKKRWAVMPMGALNSAATFCAMMETLKQEWNKVAAEKQIQHCDTKVIVDDVLIYGRDSDELIRYFGVVVDVIKHHRATLKLKKCKWFGKSCEFVGVDVTSEGNKPAESKLQAFLDLPAPRTWHDLRMIIGAFGFYGKWIPNYELVILPWRDLLAQQPDHGKEIITLDKIWKKEHQDLLDRLKRLIVGGPLLQRPDFDRRLYLKTDWSKDGVGVALLQAEDTPEARAAEEREDGGGPCEFDRSVSGLRLRPIAFFSRKTTSKSEQSLHSFVGEAAAVLFGVRKCRKWLVGKEFTILSDCSGLSGFMDPKVNDKVMPHHKINRWRAELMQYHFRLEHRPGRMMFECDLLSRYNQFWEEQRDEMEKQRSKLAEAEAEAKVPAQEAVSDDVTTNEESGRVYASGTRIVPVNIGTVDLEAKTDAAPTDEPHRRRPVNAVMDPKDDEPRVVETVDQHQFVDGLIEPTAEQLEACRWPGGLRLFEVRGNQSDDQGVGSIPVGTFQSLTDLADDPPWEDKKPALVDTNPNVDTRLESTVREGPRGISNRPAWMAATTVPGSGPTPSATVRVGPESRSLPNAPLPTREAMQNPGTAATVPPEPAEVRPVFAFENLPRIQYVGDFHRTSSREQPLVTLARPISNERSIMLVSAIGAPVSEALVGAGIIDRQVIRLEENPDEGLPKAVKQDLYSQSINDWEQYLASEPTAELPVIEWMVVCYPGEHRLSDGRPDKEYRAWARRMVHLAEVTAKACRTQAIVFLVPDR